MKININDYLRAIIIRHAGDNFQLANELQDKLSDESKYALCRIIESLEKNNDKKFPCG